MRTWLDSYVAGAKNSLARAVSGGIRTVERAGITDFEAMAQIVFTSLQVGGRIAGAIERAAAEEDSAFQGRASYAESTLRFHLMLSPHLQTNDLRIQPGVAPPAAVHATASLCADLVGAEPPDPERVATLLRAHSYCIDIPNGALMLGPDLCVRSVFTLHMGEDAPPPTEPVLCAILAPSNGSNSMMARVQWSFGGPPSSFSGFMPGADDEAAAIEASLRVQKAVEDFVGMLLLYRDTLGAPPLPQIPHLANAERRRRARNSQAGIAKKFSLFRVDLLDSPRGRFGRHGDGEGKGEGGWRLDVRQKVKGHFRLQPYGPHSVALADRPTRLIWIAAFERGPKDGRTRESLQVLRPGMQTA